MRKVCCDKWTLLKIVELLVCIACVVTKRVTDDETHRVHLLLQRRSREWPLLTRVAYGRIGEALGDVVYGGYTIITAGLLLARIIGEIPTPRRISEYFFLGVGTLLFVILGALEFAALDDLPPDLEDNAAILGSLSITAALLFLIDLAGPKGRNNSNAQTTKVEMPLKKEKSKSKDSKKVIEVKAEVPPKKVHHEVAVQSDDLDPKYRSEWERKEPSPKPGRFPVTEEDLHPSYRSKSEKWERVHYWDEQTPQIVQYVGRRDDNVPNGAPGKKYPAVNGFSYHEGRSSQRPRSEGSKYEDQDQEFHGPVWSRSRLPRGHYDNVSPVLAVKQNQPISYLLPMPPLAEAPENGSPNNNAPPPSSPTDPGYVQYTAEKWNHLEKSTKTPRHSPTKI